ncbi:unnamed protein product [Plutella xylostella]|uniref:(diamondback moth) hypothetical protein n=1 Tax=Plutella xylostella TaxID=51655 RepID=A0A8S4F8L0_PLUXY|nr:unnamed protein product [Plutella xylostella]
MRSDVLAPSELEGTDYLLSSTMRLEDSFLQILAETWSFKPDIKVNPWVYMEEFEEACASFGVKKVKVTGTEHWF